MIATLTIAMSLQGASPVIVLEDRPNDIAVTFQGADDDNVEFRANLPVGWTFKITVDGDNNGRWGTGVGTPKAPPPASLDRTFGQDSRLGPFCAQYVYTAAEDDPSEVFVSSNCGRLPSRGRVELSGLDGQERFDLRLVLPAHELFGDRAQASIRACLWNATKWTCQQRLPNLLTIRRPDAR